MGWEDGGTNSAPWTARCLSDRRCGGRALLRALLHPTDSASCFACRAILRAALDRKDAPVSLVITTFSHLRLVGAHHCCLLNLALARRCPRGANRWRRDAICSSILLRTTGFSSGAIKRKSISSTTTSCLSLHPNLSTHGIYFRRTPVSTLAAGSCRAHGRRWSKTLRSIPRPTLSIFLLKTGHYPVRDFPILAKLLAERYQPVARTAEGVIYHRNDSPGVAHQTRKATTRSGRKWILCRYLCLTTHRSMDLCAALRQSSMRILITGGAGFIGRHISEHFQHRAEVRVLDNLRTGFKSNLCGLDCRLVVGSILDRDLVRGAMRGVDFVFHLAAMVSVQESMQKPNECARINTRGTAIVLEEAARSGVKKLIFSSSAAIYGDDPTNPKMESMPSDPKNPYATSKTEGERHCRSFTDQGRLATVSLRYFTPSWSLPGSKK